MGWRAQERKARRKARRQEAARVKAAEKLIAKTHKSINEVLKGSYSPTAYQPAPITGAHWFYIPGRTVSSGPPRLDPETEPDDCEPPSRLTRSEEYHRSKKYGLIKGEKKPHTGEHK